MVREVLRQIEQQFVTKVHAIQRMVNGAISEGKTVDTDLTPQPITQTQANPTHPNEVWVVYGRNLAARDLMFALLRSVGLTPRDFEQAGKLTKWTAPM